MKKECENIVPRLSAFLDNEMTAEEKKRIEIHLSECHACSEIYKEMKEAWTSFGECLSPLPQFDATSARRKFWNNVEAKNIKPTQSVFGLYKFLTKLVIVGAFLLAIPLGYSIGQKLLDQTTDVKDTEAVYFLNDIGYDVSEEIALSTSILVNGTGEETGKTEEKGVMQQ